MILGYDDGIKKLPYTPWPEIERDSVYDLESDEEKLDKNKLKEKIDKQKKQDEDFKNLEKEVKEEEKGKKQPKIDDESTSSLDSVDEKVEIDVNYVPPKEDWHEATRWEDTK